MLVTFGEPLSMGHAKRNTSEASPVDAAIISGADLRDCLITLAVKQIPLAKCIIPMLRRRGCSSVLILRSGINQVHARVMGHL